MSEKALVACPKCKKNSLVRLISGGSGILFKGSGFYETDYKKKTTSETKSESSGSKEAAKPETKAEPAPAPSKSSESKD
jgi:predicted nucleic acid-binding Zn ribbon protein